MPPEEFENNRGFSRRQFLRGVGATSVAAGVLTELREKGVRCPEDVLLTGYDDAAPIAEILGLTTVRQPFWELGREAARLLRQGSDAPRTVMLTPAVIVRSTSTRQAVGRLGEPGRREGAA